MHAARGLRPLLLASCLGISGGAATPVAAALVDSPDFPLPDNLRPAVAFWKRVYLEITTDMGFLHDDWNLGVVYETVRFGVRDSDRTRQRTVDARRRVWRGFLLRAAAGGLPSSSAEEIALARLQTALGRPPSAADLKAAAGRIRFQLGQRDKFRDGLIRSGASEDAMRAVFRERGLPEDLAYLPHVESSFNPHAYSKYGAAGLWQFMRSTGRRYLRIDYVVDERLDPMAATRAAARLLEENYESLGTWPLAITAYNHGRSGLQRAVRVVGTPDIGRIVESYRSRLFGFASRNFYAQFMAARDIVRTYRSYFGPLERARPEAVDEVTLPFYTDASTLQRYLGVAPEVVRHYNPALRAPVFQSGKRIPEGYVLRLPAGTIDADGAAWLAAIPDNLRHKEQDRPDYYRVRRGDTLTEIARAHGTTVGALVAANGLSSRHRIYSGQVLELPETGSRARAAPSVVREARAEPPAPSAPSEKDAKPEGETPSPAAPGPREAAPMPAPEPSAVAEASGLEDAGADLDAAVAGVSAPSEVSTVLEIPEPPPVTVPFEPLDGAAMEGAAHDPVELPAEEAPAGVPDDPSWWIVDKGSVIVAADETLGHFADWLEISAHKLRKLNGLSPDRKLHVGQRLRLEFSRVSEEAFLERRIEYHKGIEEDFFGSYRIAGTVLHRVERGESPWGLAHRTYGVPIWLLQRYNPQVDFERVHPGAELTIPVVERLPGS